MKSFKQFIEERYSFRLGGSQKKGFDQNGFKTLDKLVEGDKFYVWISNDEKEVLEMTFRTFVDYFSDKNYMEIETAEDEPFCINKRDFRSSVSYGETQNKWCVATTFDELQETVEREFGVKIEKENITNWPS